MNNTDISALDEIDVNALTEYSSHVFIDQVLASIYKKNTNIVTGLPAIGAHLISPRGVYTHHGLYCGLDDTGEPYVIHYAGFSEAFKSAPVEIISLNEFADGNGFTIHPHTSRTFSPEKSVERAKNRLQEDRYNLAFNNCEHFVNCCIEGIEVSRQVTGVTKTGAKVVTKVAAKSNVVVNVAIEAAHLTSSIKAFIRGDITKEKLLSEVGHSAVTTGSMAWYGALGQAAIPIPGVGLLVGASVGYFIGNMLHQSGHIALGETAAVKEARERREQIKKMCEVLIPEIRAQRAKLEEYLATHFQERQNIFIANFDAMDKAITSGNSGEFVDALHSINTQFGKELQFRNFEEFDELIESEEAFKF